jgi:hypothetical protein
MFLLAIAANAQGPCRGDAVYRPAACAGDEAEPAERELLALINAYRASKGVPEIRLSDQLSRVAHRHLIDLEFNIGSLTHSWSDCRYDIGDRKTWGCLFEAPKRVAGYQGTGYENLFRNFGAPATPSMALEAWKKSPPHNALILNLAPFAGIGFDGLGIAILGDWAAVWFGSPVVAAVPDTRENGLGIGFGQLVDGLAKTLSIEKAYALEDSAKWVGKSKDGTVGLEVFGSETDVREASFRLRVRADRRGLISPAGRSAVLTVLNNLVPGWTTREQWLNRAIAKIGRARTGAESVTIGGKVFELSVASDRSFVLSVTPAFKPKAVEY